MSDKNAVKKPAYSIFNVPWEKHPLDASGRKLVMRGPSGHHMTVAQTKHTNGYHYWLMISEPPIFVHLQALDLARHTEMTASQLDDWLSRFSKGDLRFGNKAYSPHKACVLRDENDWRAA